jgi:hypothetical protein
MSESEVNSPNSYPNLNVTGADTNSNLSITPNVTSVDVIDPNAYPKINVTLTDYPSITVVQSPDIIIGGGGNGSGSFVPGPAGPAGPAGARGATGATGAPGTTGYGYTGAFISGSTLYMVPVVDGIPQSAVPIGTVSGGGSETLWTDPDPTLVTIGGLPSGSTLVGDNAIKILEKILYPYQPVSFSSFSANLGSSVLELNQTLGSSTINASWSTSGPTANWTPNSLSIVRKVNGVGGTTMDSGFSYNASPRSLVHPSYQYTTPTTLSFTISGSQTQGSNPEYIDYYYWLYKVYWGLSASTSITDFTGFSSAFASSSPTTARTFTTDGSERYYYFAIPSAFSNYISFKDTTTNNTVPFNSAVTISVTNDYGLSISYKYYRSLNSSSGSVTILPSIS